MNEATKQFFAKLYLQKSSSDDYVDWAIASLEDGFDSKNLRMLAATDKPFYPLEIEDGLQNVLRELDWKQRSKKESLLSYSKELARRTVSGELSLTEGCKEIYLISLYLDYPEELKGWLYLDEGYDPISMEWLYDFYEFRVKEKEKWIEAVFREAEKLAKINFFEVTK